MPDCLQVITTVDTKEHATAIAQGILEGHLAACVQILGPILSSYWWRGKIEDAEEWHCIIKTASKKYAELERTIRSLHSYEEPEIVAFPIIAGSRTYLQWIEDSVK
jgi:periplasmic divalent cation tolerance protein